MSDLHFSVGSVAGHDSNTLDLSQDLALVKATLMYADRVTLFSMGSAVLSGIAEYQESTTADKAKLVVRYLGDLQPAMSAEEITFFEAVVGLRGRKQQRKISKRTRDEILAMVEEERHEMDAMVVDQHRAAGIEGFRDAVSSGLLHIHPFRQASAEALVEAMIKGGGDLLAGVDLADAILEYIEQTMRMVRDGNTYPVFDDLTGDLAAECVASGLVAAPQASEHRSRYGGLAADLLARLPLFEQATLAEALDVRRELDDPLQGFRLAVADFSREIASAGWDLGFADEADVLFREKVEPEVERIEAAISENRDLQRMLERTVGQGATGTVIGAVIGSASDLSNLAAVASGLTAAGIRAEIDRRQEMRSIQENQLYFFYRAGRQLSRGR